MSTSKQKLVLCTISSTYSLEIPILIILRVSEVSNSVFDLDLHVQCKLNFVLISEN